MNKRGLGLSVGIASVAVIGAIYQPQLAQANNIKDHIVESEKTEQVALLRDERVKNVLAKEKAVEIAQEALATKVLASPNLALEEAELDYVTVVDASQEVLAEAQEAEAQVIQVEAEEELVQVQAEEAQEEQVLSLAGQEEDQEESGLSADQEVEAEEDHYVSLASIETEEEKEPAPAQLPAVESKKDLVSVPFEGWLSANLNIRKEPSTEAPILGVLPLASKVTGRLADGWLEFEYKNQKAYLSAHYLSAEEIKLETPVEEAVDTAGEREQAPAAEAQVEEVKEEVKEEAKEEVQEEASLDQAYDQAPSKSGYVKSNLNVRDKPSMDSKILGVLVQGTEVQGREANGWVQIQHQGQTAYVAASYITDQAPRTEAQAQEQVEAKTEAASSGTAQDIASDAKNFLGFPYVWGAHNPNTGFDCSGLVYYLYQKHAGVALNRSSYSMANNGYAVSKENLKPGDILFFNAGGNSRISHVGLYIGGGQMVHSSTPQTGVIQSSIEKGYWANTYVTARRVLN